jgi:hypothetical protein
MTRALRDSSHWLAFLVPTMHANIHDKKMTVIEEYSCNSLLLNNAGYGLLIFATGGGALNLLKCFWGYGIQWYFTDTTGIPHMCTRYRPMTTIDISPVMILHAVHPKHYTCKSNKGHANPWRTPRSLLMVMTIMTNSSTTAWRKLP